MKNRIFMLFILIICSCTPDITQDVNYLFDNGVYEVYPRAEIITTGNISAIDSIKESVKRLKPSFIGLDMYRYPLGPAYTLKNEPIEDLHGVNNHWPLGFLTDFPFVKKISFNSLYSFTFEISTNNKLKHLNLSSHSFGRVYWDDQIHFNKLKNLETIRFRNFDLLMGRLKGISQIKTLQSITADNCKIDLKDLLGLKSTLRYLNLSNSKVLNWHLLSEFNQLEILYISNIENIILSNKGNVKFLYELKELSVKRNSINDLKSVENLNKLRKLYIHKTEIKEIPIKLKNKKDLEIFI